MFFFLFTIEEIKVRNVFLSLLANHLLLHVDLRFNNYIIDVIVV